MSVEPVGSSYWESTMVALPSVVRSPIACGSWWQQNSKPAAYGFHSHRAAFSLYSICCQVNLWSLTLGLTNCSHFLTTGWDLKSVEEGRYSDKFSQVLPSNSEFSALFAYSVSHTLCQVIKHQHGWLTSLSRVGECWRMGTCLSYRLQIPSEAK